MRSPVRSSTAWTSTRTTAVTRSTSLRRRASNFTQPEPPEPSEQDEGPVPPLDGSGEVEHDLSVNERPLGGPLYTAADGSIPVTRSLSSPTKARVKGTF